MVEPIDNNVIFANLLKRHESDTLDFKRELPDFTSTESREKFIKDVICLSNTQREMAAYIVFGVDHNAKTGLTLVGLPAQIDGVTILDQLNDTVTQPRLTVRYIPVSQDGKHFGILEIPVQRGFQRPFLPLKNTTELRKDELWFRRDSQNTKANFDETLMIAEWFRGGELTVVPSPDTSGEWEQFLQAVCRFEAGPEVLQT